MGSTRRLLNPNNNEEQSLTGLENDASHMHFLIIIIRCHYSILIGWSVITWLHACSIY